MTATQTSPTATAAPARRPARAAGTTSAWPRVIAAIHTQGDSVKVVVGRQDSRDATPAIVEAVTIPATDTTGLSALLHRHKAVAVLHLIPSASTVVRCTALPSGLSTDRQQAAAALSLVAESEMPSMIPAHRRAAGIIHPGLDSAPEAVLAVGWPERGSAVQPQLPVKDQSWTPELVALAALARALGGVELAMYADRLAGSVALVATSRPHHAASAGGMNGTPAAATPKTVARVLRGDTSSDSAWHASLQRAVNETAASLSIPPAPVEVSDSPASLVLLGSPMRRPRGVPSEAAWLPSYGLAYGALCAVADSDPATRSLALLRADAPREDSNIIVRFVEYFAKPQRAAIALVICLAVLLLWPLAVAKSRELILTGRAGGTQELDKRLKEAERRVAFYKQLREKRWPMTKLLADISGAAPVGVHVDTISVSREQGVNVRGRAEKPELVTDFRSNLAATGVFGGVTTPNVETESGAITFQLEAQVVAPQYSPLRKKEQDFVKEPLAVRLYGERARTEAPASTTAASTGSDKPSTTASTDTPTRSSGRSSRGSLRGEAGGGREESTSGTRRSASGAGAIPEPLSDAEIAKLDRAAAMKEWTGRKKAAGTPDLDPAVKQRLLEESEKCKTRMQEAAKSG